MVLFVDKGLIGGTATVNDIKKYGLIKASLKNKEE